MDRWFKYLLAPIRQYMRNSKTVRINDNGDGTVSFHVVDVTGVPGAGGGSGGGGSGLDWELDGGDPAGSNTFWDMEGGSP